MIRVDYNKEVEDRLNSLFQILHKRGMSESEIGLIRRAADLALDAHKLQKRKTGEPYIIHPIAVARIMAEEFLLGVDPIIAAFLHDVVEDTSYTLEDIRSLFGNDVAFLVGAVTKEKKERYEMSKQLDNFKQMLDSIHYDIRALLLKLADRLHNMRTLDSMRMDKQMKISGETDYFYAPLANRLGLYEVKTELENLSLKFRCPHEFASLEQELENYKEANLNRLDSLTGGIRELLLERGMDADVFVKYRSIYSVWHKMQIQGCDFKHIGHKHVVQIVFKENEAVSEKNQCLQTYSILTDVFKEKPGSLRNYIDTPKENGYQSLHVKLMNEQGEWEEIHIDSERMRYNSRMGCITERVKGVKNWIEKFKGILKDIAYHGKEGGFIEDVVSSFYNDDIIVFTPKGNGVILPQNATALDFAYEIHSNIGNHAQYARINRVLKPVKTVLKRGDCVEIGVNEQVCPKKEWLEHVITYKAKRNIASYVRSMSEHHVEGLFVRCNQCHPLPGDEVIGFETKEHSVVIHKRNCHEAIMLASQNGDQIMNVDFTVTDTLYPVILNIKAVDRYHLLKELVDVITEDLKLSIERLNTITEDEIVDCTICFDVHSLNELTSAISHINFIDGIDEVKRLFD